MRNKSVKFIVHAAIIAALYVVLTHVANALGLANAVDCVEIVARELVFQSFKQRSLLLVEGFVGRGFIVEVVSVHHSNASVAATVNGFNRIRAHELRNIAPNCHFRDVELLRQIAVCIVSSQAQHFQQTLTAFTHVHALAAFPSPSLSREKQ